MPEWLLAVLFLVGLFGVGGALYAVLIWRDRGDPAVGDGTPTRD
ncbi:hypothetical protein [Nonomuraea indica]|uniref:Uncharacterized protein n=1 Tax=Nonomuraea indica TaxID=1581193 RepID=A0ABW8A4P5_9ACTN|nr:hypothetical protein [Nonomuraea indica]